MKRFMLALVGCLLFAGGLMAFTPNVNARAATASVISGVVVNGTHGNAVVAGQKVTLQRSAGNSTQDVATTTTGSTGQYDFNGLSINSGDTYAVYTQFQGGMFSSQTVTSGGDNLTSLELTVYDTTNDDVNLRVTVATLLVRQPRQVNGLIGIGAVVSIENTGKTAFVGTPTGDATKPMRLLRFATPPNASNLSLGIGFSGSQIITTDKGFGATATVPPGTSDFAYSIDIPYTGTAADLSYKAIYPTARVLVLVPPDMFVNGKDFAAQGLIDSLGSRYQVFTAANTAAGKQVSLQLTGLPQAGEKSNLDARALTIFAALLALLALLALAFYLWRGNIASALHLIPTHAADGDALMTGMPTTGETGGEERERLLHDLLVLERAHAMGKISGREYRQRDREIRLRLREVLAASPSIQAPDVAASAPAIMDDTLATEDARGSDGDTREEVTPEQSSGGRR